MFLLDVNVVLATHRANHVHHVPVLVWFDRLVSDDAPFAVPAMVWAAFLRLATNRRVFPVPTPRADAFAFIEATRAQPGHLDLAPGTRHLALLRELCEEGDAVGDLIPDAVIAAIAAEHNCIVATLDRDFARFPSVRRLDPSS